MPTASTKHCTKQYVRNVSLVIMALLLLITQVAPLGALADGGCKLGNKVYSTGAQATVNGKPCSCSNGQWLELPAPTPTPDPRFPGITVVPETKWFVDDNYQIPKSGVGIMTLATTISIADGVPGDEIIVLAAGALIASQGNKVVGKYVVFDLSPEKVMRLPFPVAATYVVVKNRAAIEAIIMQMAQNTQVRLRKGAITSTSTSIGGTPKCPQSFTPKDFSTKLTKHILSGHEASEFDEAMRLFNLGKKAVYAVGRGVAYMCIVSTQPNAAGEWATQYLCWDPQAGVWNEMSTYLSDSVELPKGSNLPARPKLGWPFDSSKPQTKPPKLSGCK